MNNIETITCMHCNSNINKKKQEYYREEKVEYIEEVDDVKITEAFKYRWYYCNKCKNYFAVNENNEKIHLITWDDRSNKLFNNYKFDDLKRYRRIIMKDIITDLEEDFHYYRYRENESFYLRPGSLCEIKRYYKCGRVTYNITVDNNFNYEISLKRVSSRYDRLEEELKEIVYDFNKMDEYRRNHHSRRSWKFLANRIDMTEPELKLILKNKTRRKLTSQELILLMTFGGIKDVAGYTEEKLRRSW